MADTPERQNSFFISAGDATEGPFELDALRAEVASGRIDSRYQVWDDAAGAWMPLSALNELLGQEAETPAPRAKRVRTPSIPLGPSPETPGGAAKPFSFDALTPRATLPEGEASRGVVIPRASMVQRSPGTSDHAPPSPESEEEKSIEEEAASAPSPRRRIYSPMSAGANALRPFAATAKPPGETPAPAVEEESPPVATEPAMSRPAVWPIATVCVVLCLLALTVLRIAGLVNFGYREHEENQRLKGELNALKEKLAIEQRGLKKIMAEKAEYLERFAAAQVLVRNMRISVFASTKRQLQLGDRPGVDQRLFELDQLNKLVPEDEAERKVRRELTDTYFGGARPAATP